MKTRNQQRTGNILVLAAVLMVVMVGVVAFAVDLGHVYLVRSQMQAAADSAALAGTWELLEDRVVNQGATNNYASVTAESRKFAGKNFVGGGFPMLLNSDVEIGHVPPNAYGTQFTTAAGHDKNAVRVNVQRTDSVNGEVPLFFAKVFGKDKYPTSLKATARFKSNFRGFEPPSNGDPNVDILPFALDRATWTNLLAGSASDDYSWDKDNDIVDSGPDGKKEVNLYPQGTGSPGNRGTVDIGSSNNSTNDISRQIVHGISPSDFAHHGGSIELDANSGETSLNGDTGISAGVKDELASIIGETRIIPIFDSVAGNGNNAQYVITEWAGVRIMKVKLTGKMSGKHLIIQPAPVITRAGIPADPSSQESVHVYSPAMLSR